MQRAESVISQAGGKGVNISRAASPPTMPTIAVLPAAKDDPFVLELLAAGIDCRPVQHAGDLRVNITITEPDGTTTKLNSPGPAGDPGAARGADRRARTPCRHRRLGRAGRLAAARRPARVVRRAGHRPARRRRPVAVDTSDAPLKALVDALPDRQRPT